MINRIRGKLSTALLAGASAIAIVSATPAAAQDATRSFDIPAQSLSSALLAYSRQSDTPVIASMDLLKGKTAPEVRGELPQQLALTMLLEGSGLRAVQGASGGIVVEKVTQAPQGGSAAGAGAEVEALIVTAQKREEDIQDVPIAISAFTQKDLEDQKIEGGFDLLKAVPNVTFSKNNFSGYNFSIRGIGTKAISVATDPGVAVAFNSTALIRNRLFEQEYFDVQRVEVLRGPQGTLYGRNATAGVVNVISNTPDLDAFEGRVKAEVGNYNTSRLSGFINVPLVADMLGVRLAGALTKRDGYDFNTVTGNPVNGRDLYSTRLTIGFEPNERLRADLIWERFNEDDDRSRTGKQLCHHDAGPETVGASAPLSPTLRGFLSQGCKPGSLYADAAFGTPNGLSVPFIIASVVGFTRLGYAEPPYNEDGSPNILREINAIRFGADPYGNAMQSRDLREISSLKDPKYRATADVFEMNVAYDISGAIQFISQTAYVNDAYYAMQDYNRFNSAPVFGDSSSAFEGVYDFELARFVSIPSPMRGLTPGGVFCDPQLGCSNTIVGIDIVQAKSEQFSQEFRLQSSFDGRVNFSGGVNYTRYRTDEDYYVFYNLITAIAQAPGLLLSGNNSADPTKCQFKSFFGERPVVNIGEPGSEGCIYIDPNPIDRINGDGHNYFRSRNPYKLTSTSAFGELYWQASESFKITAGLRYTDDQKRFTPVPSQVLLSSFYLTGGTVDRGYPELPDIKQRWGEFTGKLGFDWQPDLNFTDDTLLYGSYSRGYKGGGANPPGIGFDPEGFCDICAPIAKSTAVYPKTFEPEFVDAFEIGAKNTLLGGAMILNASAFYYDYKDYQVSKIVDRSAANENFDAAVWGLELESIWKPTVNLRFNAALGYQRTRIADGEQSIDLMDRIQGNEGYILLKPWYQLTSNCVALTSQVEAIILRNQALGGVVDYGAIPQACPGSVWSSGDPNEYDRSVWPNGGEGFYDDIGGNELPNAPRWTAALGAEYGRDILDGIWRATVRVDTYWQADSYARVYNAVNDELRGWNNTNLSLWIEKPEADLRFEIYVKNVFDETPITDAFINSDDTALTTNVFTLDPRLIGLSIRKGF